VALLLLLLLLLLLWKNILEWARLGVLRRILTAAAFGRTVPPIIADALRVRGTIHDARLQ